MASAAVSVGTSDMECVVCHELFTEPKLLPCAHLLCCSCLVTQLETQPEAPCPLCRCPIVDREKQANQTLEDVAASFPTDRSMVALINAAKLLAKQHLCKVCVDTAASSMCLDCGDMLCCSCTVAHGKLSATSHHTTEDLISLTAERLAARRPVTCSVHTNRPSELYCPVHEKSICLLCATTTHRTCQAFVQDVEKKVKEADALLSELSAALTAGETKLDKAISQLDHHFKDVQTQAKAMLAEIQAVCDRIEKAVRACREHLTELVVDAQLKIEHAVNCGKALLVQRRSNLTSHKQVMQRVKDMTPSDDIEDMTAAMKNRVNGLDVGVSFPMKAQAISSLTITFDQTLLSQLEQELSALGQVHTIPAALPAPISEEEESNTNLHFHANHGSSIMLTNNWSTAKRIKGDGHGIVVFSTPMETNKLYEVQIEEIDSRFRSHTIYLGVLLENPNTITLPAWSGDLKSDIVIRPCSICNQGTETQTEIALDLQKVNVGGHVGMALDSSRHLHLYTDAKDMGIVAKRVKQPAYAMFDLLAYWKKITVLPAKVLPVLGGLQDSQ